MDNIKKDINAVKPWLMPILVGTIIIATMGILIRESGAFYNSIFDTIAYGFIVAAVAECIAGALILCGSRGLWSSILKWSVLIGFGAVIVGGSCLFATKPITDSTNIAAIDRLKLSELNKSIASLNNAVEAVDGQKLNTAMAVQELRKLERQKAEIISNMSPNTTSVVVNLSKIWVLVALRVLLQLGNWMLIHSIKGLTPARNEFESMEIQPISHELPLQTANKRNIGGRPVIN